MTVLSTNAITLDGIKKSVKGIFATGADMKSRFSFCQNGDVFISDDFGDLSDATHLAGYMDSVQQTKDSLRIEPDIVAYDLHPGYFSSQVRHIFPGAQHLGIQHHHAHIASMVATTENIGPVIGVSFDGTGYGTDGHLWGGEFLVVSPSEWKRVGHLHYLNMPGNEMAIREPWRMAVSLLYDTYGSSVFGRELEPLQCESLQSYVVIQKMFDRNFNMPLTSSCGRLFDAVSSLLGITHRATFEAEAAINLEKEASKSFDPHAYPIQISKENDMYIVHYESLVQALISDIQQGVRVEDIARRFHNTLGRLIVEMCTVVRLDTGSNYVVLSGGVFQNALLATQAQELLKQAGFSVLEAENVPVNDLGICIGQTYVALNSKL